MNHYPGWILVRFTVSEHMNPVQKTRKGNEFHANPVTLAQLRSARISAGKTKPAIGCSRVHSLDFIFMGVVLSIAGRMTVLFFTKHTTGNHPIGITNKTLHLKMIAIMNITSVMFTLFKES